MRSKHCVLLLHLIAATIVLHAQSIDSVQFFIDENPLQATLATDITKLLNEKMKDNYFQQATFSCTLSDSSTVSEEIRINARGIFRRSYCFMPPLRLSFHNTTSPTLYSLNTLKLVCPCRTSAENEQLLLKEFIVYKMYNLLTDKSFRVRLLKLTYKDSRGKKKPFSQYAFFLENVDAMAKRNHCKEWKNGKIYTENTNREQMTLVAVFQYMIGNTDWAIPNQHNVKLIYSKKDSVARPYVVPYDFDYSGMVNADYAVPDPQLGIETVVERSYRGFPRTTNELQAVFTIFNQQKEKIYAMIKNFGPLSYQNKKEMTYYIDEFYETINNSKKAESVFIDNARVR
jgi:hypothetical protein